MKIFIHFNAKKPPCTGRAVLFFVQSCYTQYYENKILIKTNNKKLK